MPYGLKKVMMTKAIYFLFFYEQKKKVSITFSAKVWSTGKLPPEQLLL